MHQITLTLEIIYGWKLDLPRQNIILIHYILNLILKIIKVFDFFCYSKKHLDNLQNLIIYLTTKL